VTNRQVSCGFAANLSAASPQPHRRRLALRGSPYCSLRYSLSVRRSRLHAPDRRHPRRRWHASGSVCPTGLIRRSPVSPAIMCGCVRSTCGPHPRPAPAHPGRLS